MKKTLAKAIIFAVVVGGICYQSGPVYAGEKWYDSYGSNKIEIIDKEIEDYDGLKDPTVQHTHNGEDYHKGHDEECKEDADRLYVGDVAKMKDTLVENDKALAKKIEELERTPGPKGDKGDKGDTGATGAKGEKGDKGDKGDTGATGAKGERGADGKDGADGEDGASIAEGTYKVEKNTVVMPIKYTNGKSAGNVTIDDVASAAQNDRDHAEFREHFNELDHRVDNLRQPR